MQHCMSISLSLDAGINGCVEKETIRASLADADVSPAGASLSRCFMRRHSLAMLATTA